ncbi:energy transducer TonB [Lysobacteraceae bacterium NML120232]|nr:energy transducer TonB [Xanthomonadaceae bacterium NML08-0793]PJK13360.1 energy transducer TonB [Xanthomonadaceae bacterium NML120232]
MPALKLPMSRDMSTPPPPPTSAPTAAPRKRTRSRLLLLWILPAFIVLGGLLFLLVWSIEKEKVFYTAPPSTAADAQDDGQVKIFEPLPTPQNQPLAESGENRSLLPAPPPEAAHAQAARPVEQPNTRPANDMAAQAPTAAAPTRSSGNSPPVPISQPAPRYPRNALRNGIGGFVQLQVDVGVDGVPTSVSLIRSSGSRELDRAASEAVRRWRFQPAMENGQPSSGRVTVPIQFTPN